MNVFVWVVDYFDITKRIFSSFEHTDSVGMDILCLIFEDTLASCFGHCEFHIHKRDGITVTNYKTVLLDTEALVANVPIDTDRLGVVVCYCDHASVNSRSKE